MAVRDLSHDAGGDRLLPLWEKVPEGRMRGSLRARETLLALLGSRNTIVLRTPHPALRATFSHKGRREGVRTLSEEAPHGRR